MIDAIAHKYQEAVAAWVNLVRRFPMFVTALAVLLTMGIGWYVGENASINTDTSDMLSPDLPFRRNSHVLSEAFPQFSDNILVVIEGDSVELADDAAIALMNRMRMAPERFGDIYDVEGDQFFRRNALLYLDIDELSELGDNLAQAQPFLGTLVRDPSLRGLFRLIALMIDDAENGTLPVELTKTLEAIADVAEAQIDGRFSRLSWQALIVGDKARKPPFRRLVLIQPVLDFGSLQPASGAMTALRSIASDMKLDATRGVRMRLTGSAALAEEELQSVEEGMGLAAIVALFLVLSLLFTGLRSVRLVFAALATLVMGLVWTTGFAVATVGQFNLISVAFAVLFIGLSVDFGIHFSLRYREAIAHGASHAKALGNASTSVGGALSLCAVAAAIGFFSFLPTAYLGLAELGLIAGTGMFIALFANLTVLPALLTLLPIASAAASVGGAIQNTARDFITSRARQIVWAAIVLGTGAAALTPLARFDFDPLNLRNPNSESVSTLVDLMSDSRTSPYAITILVDSLDAAKRLGAELQKLESVDAAVTLADFVPEDQQRKLAVIDEMALFLIPALTLGRPESPPTSLQLHAAITNFRTTLETLVARGAEDRLTKAAGRLSAALSAVLANTPEAEPIKQLEHRLLATLAPQLERLREMLQVSRVDERDLPLALFERQIAKDGRARLQVFAKQNLRNREAQQHFVGEVTALVPDATGAPVVIFEAGKAVIEAFVEAAVFAATLVIFLLLVVLRSLRDTLLVLAPLVLSALLTVAATVLLNQPFNFANVIVLPLLFGIGVASAIHMVLRERARMVDITWTSTPRAVLFSALTTIGSFASIALSSHHGTASMGVLLTIAITFTLLSALVVLPALMVVLPPMGAPRNAPPLARTASE